MSPPDPKRRPTLYGESGILSRTRERVLTVDSCAARAEPGLESAHEPRHERKRQLTGGRVERIGDEKRRDPAIPCRERVRARILRVGSGRPKDGERASIAVPSRESGLRL